MRALSFILILLAAAGAWAAQLTFNVTNTPYGALGDEGWTNGEFVQVATTSNSATVVPLFAQGAVAADVGKAVEIGGAGALTWGPGYNNTQQTNAEDYRGTITGLSGTNWTVSPAPLATTTNWCVYGTDNFNAVSNVLLQAKTNDIIYFPTGGVSVTGRYLVLPRFYGIGSSSNGFVDDSIVLRHGLIISGTGDGPSDSALVGQGASWTNDAGGTVPTRGFLLDVNVATNQGSPLLVSNIVLDGGVPVGNAWFALVQGNPGEAMGLGSTLGWDENHSAVVNSDNQLVGTIVNQQFVNVGFTRWRGEMAKTISANTNGNWYLTNCWFSDGNATALNPTDVSLNATHCDFTNLLQVGEFFGTRRTNASSFLYCFATNIVYNGFACNGGEASDPAFTVAWSTFYFDNYGQNGFEFEPAANVVLATNTVYVGPHCTVFSIGTQGSQNIPGSPFCANTNIAIVDNQVYATASNSVVPGAVGNIQIVYGFGGGGVSAVTNLAISNNYVFDPGTIQAVVDQGPYSSLVTYQDNTNVGGCLFNLFAAPKMLLIPANSPYTPAVVNGFAGATDLVDYAQYGPLVAARFNNAGGTMQLRDTNSTQFPLGTFATVSNLNSGTFFVQSQSGGPKYTATNNASLTLFYNTAAGLWQPTIQQPAVPAVSPRGSMGFAWYMGGGQ